MHLPQIPEESLTSKTLAQKIGDFGGDVSKIQKWDGSGWKTYVTGAPFGIFDIKIGEGYFILANKESTFSYQGQSSVCNDYLIHPGWNLLGFPSGGPFTSFTLAQLINDNSGDINKIQKWDGSGWATYAVGAPFGFFDIQTNEGYFLLSEGQCSFNICMFIISNVRDTQFTISWVSDASEEGILHYGTDSSLEFTQYDDRGQISSNIHHITVKGLQPDTIYFYDIVSGSTRYDNAGEHYTIQTGPAIIPSGSMLAAGNVMNSDAHTPASDALVYITLKDIDGKGSSDISSMVSVLTDSNGFWYAELVNIRTKDYQYLFEFTENIDIIMVNVDAGKNGRANSESEIFDTQGGTVLMNIIIQD